eukprot:1136697-Pelagomonas_calceolata.AAC.12
MVLGGNMIRRWAGKRSSWSLQMGSLLSSWLPTLFISWDQRTAPPPLKAMRFPLHAYLHIYGGQLEDTYSPLRKTVVDKIMPLQTTARNELH